MNIPGNILTLLFGIVLTLASLWYGQNHGLMPVAASVEADQVDDIFNLMMTIATGLFLLIEGILIYVMIKFRRKPGDQTDGPPIEGNIPLEILWTAIPTVIVFILAVYSFEVYNNMGGLDPEISRDAGPAQIAQVSQPMAHDHFGHGGVAIAANDSRVALGLGATPGTEGEPPLVVNVNGIQYAWIFTYPDTGIVAGELHIPNNRQVQLNISAGDVLHAFWLPEFRLKQDAVPGREVQLVFKANRIGEYPIICAELCGAYHGGMKTKLFVESDEDYEQWVQSNMVAQSDSAQADVAQAPGPVPQSNRLTAIAKAQNWPEQAIATVPANPPGANHHHH